MMGVMLFGFFALIILSVIVFTGQGFGIVLDSSSDVNELNSVEISVSSSTTLMGVNFGSDDAINDVILTFQNLIDENDTVNIIFKDISGTTLGLGSQVVSPSSASVTITLSDNVGAVERPTLSTVNIIVS